jgi:hypothetical protein
MAFAIAGAACVQLASRDRSVTCPPALETAPRPTACVTVTHASARWAGAARRVRRPSARVAAARTASASRAAATVHRAGRARIVSRLCARTTAISVARANCSARMCALCACAPPDLEASTAASACVRATAPREGSACPMRSALASRDARGPTVRSMRVTWGPAGSAALVVGCASKARAGAPRGTWAPLVNGPRARPPLLPALHVLATASAWRPGACATPAGKASTAHTRHARGAVATAACASTACARALPAGTARAVSKRAPPVCPASLAQPRAVARRQC